MRSGVTKDEPSSFLKLVCPKGRVELHKHPITAAEVLKRHPRCCVTRPDVFQFPWIVVRPESVLSLGCVFFVVPRHTIHRLLQQHGMSPRKQQQQEQQKVLQQTPKHELVAMNSLDQYKQEAASTTRRKSYRSEGSLDIFLTDQSSPECSGERTDYIDKRACKPLNELTADDQLSRRHVDNMYPVKTKLRASNLNPFDDEKGVGKEKHQKKKLYPERVGKEQHQKKLYPVELWPIDLATKKHHHQQFNAFDSGCGSFRRNKGGFEAKHTDKLKSCLKEHTTNNSSTSRVLRVHFQLPVDDD